MEAGVGQDYGNRAIPPPILHVFLLEKWVLLHNPSNPKIHGRAYVLLFRGYMGYFYSNALKYTNICTFNRHQWVRCSKLLNLFL